MPSIIRRAIGTRDKFLILGCGSSEIFYRANGLMPRLISRVMEDLPRGSEGRRWLRQKSLIHTRFELQITAREPLHKSATCVIVD